LEVPKELLDPVGENATILVDFGYLENPKKIENSINSVLDQSLRATYIQFIKQAVNIMIELAQSVVEIGDLVKKYEEEISFEEEFGNNLDLDLIEKFGLFISNIFSAIFYFDERIHGGARERILICAYRWLSDIEHQDFELVSIIFQSTMSNEPGQKCIELISRLNLKSSFIRRIIQMTIHREIFNMELALYNIYKD